MMQIGEDDERERSCLNTFLETITNLEILDVRMKEVSHEEFGIRRSIHFNNGSRCPSNVSIENSALYLKEQLERYKVAIGESLLADFT